MVARTAAASAALTFLTALFGQKPDALYILAWTLPDKRSRWFQDIGEATRYVESRRDLDVYVGVSLSPQDFGSDKRCPSDKAAGIVALWADLDVRDLVHTKQNLPPTIDDALGLVPPPFTASIVVHSGHGLQCWWLLKEPEIFESDEHRNKVKAIVERWARLLKLNGAARGWTVDSVFDLARVLRVPGTTKTKDAAAPKPVEIIATSDRRYNLSDFEGYLDQVGVPDPAAERRWQEKWKEQQHGTPFSVRADATVPPEIIQHQCDADQRFRLTWHRQRNDFTDQSQSSYDMALADFGVKAVLPDQVIVDMLIEHRRIHRHRPKLREDYYRRTLAKAHEHMDKTTCVNQSASQPPPVGASGEPGPADETLRKALLCERLSTLLGNVITILRILKVAGSDPTYHLELDGCTVILGNVNQLIDQGRLRTRVAEQTEKMIPRLTRREWDPVARMLLEAVTICPGGAEADYKGRARMLLEDYLQDFDCTADPQNRPRDLRKKPVVFEGRLSIHSVDFRQHIFHTNGETVGPKVCASMLIAIGAKPYTHYWPGGQEQNRWVLPADFDPAVYGRDAGTGDQGGNEPPATE
jgi:hypothetical protein